MNQRRRLVYCQGCGRVLMEVAVDGKGFIYKICKCKEMNVIDISTYSPVPLRVK